MAGARLPWENKGNDRDGIRLQVASASRHFYWQRAQTMARWGCVRGYWLARLISNREDSVPNPANGRE